MSRARERPRCRTQFGDHRSADLAGQPGLIQVSQEEAAQAAGRDFAGEIRVIDLISQTEAQILRITLLCITVLRSRFTLAVLGTSGSLGCLFASGAG